MNYCDLIDTTYDDSLLTIPRLKWLPWIGRNYSATPSFHRLLIVGETHYARANGCLSVDAVTERHESNKHFTREIIAEYPLSGNAEIRTLNNIAPLLIQTTDYKRDVFWRSVVFYNFVQRIMRYTELPERPILEDFVHGWNVFCELLAIIQPGYCVFLGSEAHNSFWWSITQRGDIFTDVVKDRRIGRYWAYRASLEVLGRSTPLVFVKPPGSYFASTQWHEYLTSVFPQQIAELRQQYRA